MASELSQSARPLRLLLAIATLGAGGAERVLTLLAEAFAAHGHRVTLLTLDAHASDLLAVAAGVQRLALDCHGPSRSWTGRVRANWTRVRAIRRAVRQERPDVIVSFITEMNVLTLLATVGRATPVLVSERVDPRQHHPGRIWNWLRWRSYRRAAGLVVQTEAVAAWLGTLALPLPAVTVIPNPVAPCARAAARAPRARPYLLGAGRLTRQKGFDLLIRALALLARAAADVELVIAGEGPEEPALRRLAQELKVADRVTFTGRVAELGALMSECFAFVLPSRYEGFPNVLLEALACGAATIAADCPSGPREILAGGRHGVLVPCEDPEALAQAVLSLRSDAKRHAQLCQGGAAAVAPFAVQAVAAQWEGLMRRTLA